MLFFIDGSQKVKVVMALVGGDWKTWSRPEWSRQTGNAWWRATASIGTGRASLATAALSIDNGVAKVSPTSSDVISHPPRLWSSLDSEVFVACRAVKPLPLSGSLQDTLEG